MVNVKVLEKQMTVQSKAIFDLMKFWEKNSNKPWAVIILLSTDNYSICSKQHHMKDKRLWNKTRIRKYRLHYSVVFRRSVVQTGKTEINYFR